MPLIDPVPPIIIHNQKCPLCERLAKFIVIDSGRRKKFNCPKCKVFVVHKDSIEQISKFPKTIREKISKESTQCPNDMVLLIYTEETTKEIKRRCEPECNWS